MPPEETINEEHTTEVQSIKEKDWSIYILGGLAVLVLVVGYGLGFAKLPTTSSPVPNQNPEVAVLDKIQLDTYGSLEQENAALNSIIEATEDDMVYERALRLYVDNVEETDAHEALHQTIQMATDERLRAVARAAALENLAFYYIDGTFPVDELDEHIFEDPSLALVREGMDKDLPGHVVLLKYANIVSARLMSTAVLAHYYARTAALEKKGTLADFDVELERYQIILANTAETNPHIPLSRMYVAVALLYVHEVRPIEISDDENELFPDREAKRALNESVSHMDALLSVIGETELDFDKPQYLTLDFAPPALLDIALSAVGEVSVTSFSHRIVDLAIEYVESEQDAGAAVQSVVVHIESLKDAYPH